LKLEFDRKQKGGHGGDRQCVQNRESRLGKNEEAPQSVMKNWLHFLKKSWRKQHRKIFGA